MARLGAGAIAYRAAVGLLGVIALGATLELAASLNSLWRSFPAPLGGYGVAVIAGYLVFAGAGLLAVLRLPRHYALAVAVAAILATRVAVLLLVDPPLVRDPSAYDSLARGVLAGECCFGLRAMGYPIMLAGAYALGLSGKVVGFAAALTSAALLYLIVRRVAGRRAGLVAAYGYAVAPALALFSGVLMTETPYATILLGAIAAFVLLPRGALAGLSGGFVIGLSQYVRATSVFLAPAFMLPLLRRGEWRSTGIFTASLGVALLPVLLATGGVSTSTVGGLSVMMGTNQQHDGRYNNDDVALYNSWATTARPWR